jgi:hypothetical protein
LRLRFEIEAARIAATYEEVSEGWPAGRHRRILKRTQRSETARRFSAAVSDTEDNRIIEERELVRRWAEARKEAGPVLEAIRRQEIRQADNLKALALLECADCGDARASGRTAAAQKCGGMGGPVDRQGCLSHNADYEICGRFLCHSVNP